MKELQKKLIAAIEEQLGKDRKNVGLLSVLNGLLSTVSYALKYEKE